MHIYSHRNVRRNIRNLKGLLTSNLIKYYNRAKRWLSLNEEVVRILEPYNALKLFFQSQFLQENVKKAEMIYNTLNYPLNVEFQS